MWYKLIYLSLPLNPAKHRIGNGPNILYPKVKSKKSLNSILDIIARFPKKLVNLKYAFNIPFKITLKTIIMGTSYQFHDGVQLNILPKFSSEILPLNWTQKKPL